MSWLRLDDQIAHHPKTTRAGLSSWLWVCCIAYSQKFLSDGFIPEAAISSIAGGIDRPKIHISKLVKSGLLDRAQGGYQVHDYLDFNESAEHVREKRRLEKEIKARAGRLGGLRSGEVRRHAAALEAERQAEWQADTKQTASSKTKPHPIPSYKEQEQEIRAVPAAPPPRLPVENVRVIGRIAHEVLAGHLETDINGADLCEEIKVLCAIRHIAYNTVVVRKALDSAEVQRKKARA